VLALRGWNYLLKLFLGVTIRDVMKGFGSFGIVFMIILV
jgi:hypothetical protein